MLAAMLNKVISQACSLWLFAEEISLKRRASKLQELF